MHLIAPFAPVDYLVVGYIACDRTPQGLRLGGTAAYASMTARALGLRVGVVTAWGGEIPLDPLDGIQVMCLPAEHSTTFENRYTASGRIQHVHHIAPQILAEHIPTAWRHTSIIHVGPIAQEAKDVAEGVPTPALLGLTPQGWLRDWDADGRVHPCAWKDDEKILARAAAVVMSVEDVGGDEEIIERMAGSCRVLVVTEGPAGSRVYWNGDRRRFSAPEMNEVDATGAGDIYAAAFFSRLYSTRDPWEAARFATRLASFSVMRSGLESIPSAEEVKTSLVEVF